MEAPADPCADVLCPASQVCFEGGCFESIDAPADTTCPDGSNTGNGACKPATQIQADPCAGVLCPVGEACYEGGCFLSVEEAPADAPADPCADVLCPASQVCFEGGCFESIDAPADTTCPDGSNTGNGACKPATQIQADPCAGVLCPVGEACYQGGCFPQMEAPTEAPDDLCADVSCPPSQACFAGGCFESITEAATPAGNLEIIALPTGPRTSRYLAIDDATLARDETLRLTYSGLSGKPARIALIYMGDETPRPGGWTYIPAKTTSGVYEREGHSLPPFTGPYKACIAYSAELPSDASSPDAYADCLDFVLAGTSSRNARPALSLSVPNPKAGKRFTLNWSGFPTVNARISLIDTGTDLSVARGYSSSKPAGEWVLTVREPGSYEIQIYFEGEALRARMPLEVTP